MNFFSIDASSRRRPWPLRILSAGYLALAVMAGGSGMAASAAEIRELGPMINMNAPDTKLVQIKTTQVAPARVTPRVIELPALAEPKDAPLLPEAAFGQPQQIGIHRKVTEAADAVSTASLFTWTTDANGRHRAAISVHSAGAAGLRLGLLVEQLPLGTQLRVYAPGSDQTTEVAGSEVLRTLQRNLDAGETGADANTYWLPTIEGDQAALEIELAAGVDPRQLKVSLPQASHLKILPTDPEALLKASGACEVDVMCTSGYDNLRHAVALMEFVEPDGTYICTGTLVNNTNQDATPYFLGANHCISTQSVASTLETFWNGYASSCNSGQVSSDTRTLTGGATLLYASANTDTSFMRLNAAPPTGAFFASWNANAPSGAGVSIFDIHHPAGDLQKISTGSITGFATCTSNGDGTSSCNDSTLANGTFYVVNWSRGVTEGGSSGSGLFTSSGQQLMGQLLGGTSSCSNTSGYDVFGRFDVAYNAALKQWLNPGSTATTPPSSAALSPVYRFYNSTNNAHFYTSSQAERDYVIASLPNYHYEGPMFQVYNNAQPGTSPVFRFFNTASGVHFYTISAAERDYVIATYPTYQYEGPVWYAQTGAGNGASPVYRFYSSLRNEHFYTINPAERDLVEALYPDYNYEGAGYYAWLLPAGQQSF